MRLFLLALILVLTCVAPLAALATTTEPIIPVCDPTLLPNSTSSVKGGPCGLSAFELMVRSVIKNLSIIVIPIAFIMIAYAGFIIMTSGGSAEKIQKGYGMIKIAMTGLIILLMSYMLIRFIFGALGVSNTIGGQPSPVKVNN